MPITRDMKCYNMAMVLYYEVMFENFKLYTFCELLKCVKK
jgi:hypothetical protein